MENQAKVIKATLDELGEHDEITDAIDELTVSVVATKLSFMYELNNDAKIQEYVNDMQETLANSYYSLNLMETRLEKSTHERIHTVQRHIVKALEILEVKGEKITYEEVEKVAEMDEEIVEALKGMFTVEGLKGMVLFPENSAHNAVPAENPAAAQDPVHVPDPDLQEPIPMEDDDEAAKNDESDP